MKTLGLIAQALRLFMEFTETVYTKVFLKLDKTYDLNATRRKEH